MEPAGVFRDGHYSAAVTFGPSRVLVTKKAPALRPGELMRREAVHGCLRPSVRETSNEASLLRLAGAVGRQDFEILPDRRVAGRKACAR